QMIEALDRGIDAMIPESSMVRVYKEVDRRYRRGDRRASTELFRRLIPILAFTNQDVATSIAFFKRLLVRKGIFDSPMMRMPGFAWDHFNLRIADELIEDYVELEAALTRGDDVHTP
ncbi:MAG: dihydrodipicolinate synthase family protein, partial [Actinomycetota bacterium]